MSDNDVSTGRRRPAWERLLDAVARRFCADGMAATDIVTAEAGVAKMSLYNNFSSKADLIRAYLNATHEEWLGLYRTRLEHVDGPREGVLAVFDAYVDHAALAYEHGFRGCRLLNAAAELPSGDDGRAVVRAHKEHVEHLLAGHLEQMLPGRSAEAHAMAEHLSFPLEGAVARAGLEGGRRASPACSLDSRGAAGPAPTGPGWAATANDHRTRPTTTANSRVKPQTRSTLGTIEHGTDETPPEAMNSAAIS